MPAKLMKSLIVVPAYGRDYKTEKEAVAAWKAGSDFLIMDISSKDDGRYVSIRDLTEETEVKIRFNKHQDFVFVTTEQQ